MVIMTMIARLADGLPLAASMQEDEQYGRITVEYQNQAKMLFKKFDTLSPPRCTFKTGEDFFFHCLIENDVIYLALCDKNHSKRLAFSYLEDLAMEFHTLYGKRINTVNRPYSFIEFDNYIQKAKKVFTDSKARRNLYTLQSGLQDVQNVMVKNIADVLQRGTVLAELDTKAQDLSILSQKYKKDATYLNNKSMYMKAAAGCIAFVVFVLYFFIL